MQESSSNISSRNQSISNQKGMMKHGYLLYVHDKSVINISAFRCAVYAINVSITNAFPPESWETPVQHKLFQYNMTYDKITPHFTNRSASIINSVLRIIKHNLVTWRIPFALYAERRTAMLNQVAHLVSVAYVDLWLPPTWSLLVVFLYVPF